VLTNRTDLEKKLDDALSKANWGAPMSLLREIAAATNDPMDYPVVMREVWAALNHAGKNWRQIYKVSRAGVWAGLRPSRRHESGGGGGRSMGFTRACRSALTTHSRPEDYLPIFRPARLPLPAPPTRPLTCPTGPRPAGRPRQIRQRALRL
jgi:hypothetical protein